MTASERGSDPVVRGNTSILLPGSHVAVIVDSTTGAVRLVDVDSRAEVSPGFEVLPGGSSWYVSPDGRVAAVGIVNGGTQLYELQTGEQVGDPFPSSLGINIGIFTPDGRSMVTFDVPQIIWDVDPASWREKACTVAGRNLTRLEWERYLPPEEPYRATCPAVPVEM